VLAEIGARHGKSASQVALRFLLQEGAIVIPRTSKPERLAENFDVFDFTLTKSEIDTVRKLAR
jgi:2,5-diketo-D-gluconate reductase B